MRHEGQTTGLGADVGEAGVELGVRRQQAQAVGPEDAQQVLSRCIEHGLVLRLRQAGGEDDRGARAALAQGLDQARHGGWRGAWTASSGASGRLSTSG